MFESLFRPFVLYSRHSKYAPFKISYNTYKDNWFMKQLLAMCVDEQYRLKKERQEGVHLASHKGK
jgi:hypothetical protein